MRLEQQAASEERSRPARFPSLKKSWRAHIERPAIPAVSVIGACLVFFAIGTIAGEGRRPEVLARLFAPAPLDSYGDLGLIAGRTWLLPVTLVAKAVLVTAVVAMVTGSAFRLRNVARVGFINLAATASILIFVATGWLYITKKSEVVLRDEATPLLAVILLLQLLGYVAVCVFFAPMVCRAAMGQRIRPSILDPAFWLMSAASVWVWFFAAKRLEPMADSGPTIAFSMAMAFLLIQSVLVGALAVRAARPEEVT